MKKEVFYDKNALKELREFSKEIQQDFQAYIGVLISEGRLEFPEARKVTNKLFEIRVTREGIYRGFYAYVGKDYIVLLHFFQKKTQKTPLKSMNIAQQRLQHYE